MVSSPVVGPVESDAPKIHSLGSAVSAEMYANGMHKDGGRVVKLKSWNSIKSRLSGFADENVYRRQRLRLSHSCIIDPERSKFLSYWDLMSALLLVLIAVWTPFESAFLDCTDIGSPRWWVDILLNLFYFVDMILQFFTGYSTASAFGGKIVRNHYKIAKRYLSGMFVIDLLSVIPYELFAPCGGLEGLSMIRVVRLLRLMKMLRLFRGLKIFIRWQTEVGFSFRKLTLNLIFGLIVMAAHLIACLLGLVSRFQEGEDCIREELSGECATWLWFARGSLYHLRKNADKVFDEYLIALYTSMTILVHPHAFGPASRADLIVFILLTLLGGFLWCQVIARSTALCTSLDRHTIAYNQTIDDVNALSSDLGLSKAMRKRLRKFFLMSKKFSRQDAWTDLVNRMSPQLKRDTFRELNTTWLLSVKFISQCSRSFVIDVAEAMTVHAFAEHEYMGSPFHMYVLIEGMATRCSNLRVMLAGVAWGEDHLLLSNPHLLEDNTAMACVFVQTKSLSKNAFETIVSVFPEHWKQLRRACVKYAVIRGIKLYVKSIRYPSIAGEGSESSLREQEEALPEMLARLWRRRRSVTTDFEKVDEASSPSGSPMRQLSPAKIRKIFMPEQTVSKAASPYVSDVMPSQQALLNSSIPAVENGVKAEAPNDILLRMLEEMQSLRSDMHQIKEALGLPSKPLASPGWRLPLEVRPSRPSTTPTLAGRNSRVDRKDGRKHSRPRTP